jgi:phage shock protein E
MRIVYPINCLLLILFTALTSSSQTTQTNVSPIKVVSPEVFNKTYQQTTTKKIMLDVRTPAEHAKVHIKNSILLDIFRDDFNDLIKQLDRNQAVFVYCAVGGRSAEAAEILEKAGFKTIYDLDGGIKAWQKQNLPVISTVAP